MTNWFIAQTVCIYYQTSQSHFLLGTREAEQYDPRFTYRVQKPVDLPKSCAGDSWPEASGTRIKASIKTAELIIARRCIFDRGHRFNIELLESIPPLF